MSYRTYAADPVNRLSQELTLGPSVLRPLVAWVGVADEQRDGRIHAFGVTSGQARDLAQQLLALAAPEGAESTVTVGLRQKTTTRVVREATPALILRDPHKDACILRYNREMDIIDYRYGGQWNGYDARQFTSGNDIGTPTPERKAIWAALIANGGTDEVIEVVSVNNNPAGVSGASFLKGGA